MGPLLLLMNSLGAERKTTTSSGPPAELGDAGDERKGDTAALMDVPSSFLATSFRLSGSLASLRCSIGDVRLLAVGVREKRGAPVTWSDDAEERKGMTGRRRERRATRQRWERKTVYVASVAAVAVGCW